MKWHVGVLLGLLAATGCRRDGGGDPLPPGDYTPRPTENDLSLPSADRERVRRDGLRRAEVWLPPAARLPAADFSRKPPGADAVGPPGVIPCKFELESSVGRTPKFQCILAGGEV